MAPLMPLVLTDLAQASGAVFELIEVVNGLFGPRVTTAGLLPGASIIDALAAGPSIDWALLPGEALNDNGLFIDGMSEHALAERIGVPVRFSKYFSDALETVAV
jgi:hypothetical protein